MNKTIGIVGLGYVGGAIYKYFAPKRKKVFVFDKFKKIGSISEVSKADIIFICVPTPFSPKTGFDLSADESTIKNITGHKIIVVKSTIIPGSTEKLQKKYPNHKILFSPEFLRAKHAFKDFSRPDRQIVGFSKKSKQIASQILKILPKAKYSKIIDSKEAEMIKYMGNAFLALKVVFANEFFDLCKKLKINYDNIKEGAGHDKRIGLSHLDVSTDGYRGYGGGCFPKDVNALLEFSDMHKIDMSILKTAKKKNQTLLKKSGHSELNFL